MTDKPRVGVSACLLGEPVRWDGGHKLHDDVLALAALVDLVAICPEDELGLGTPREPIHLDVRRRLVGVRSGMDHTDAMTAWASERLASVGPLDGYVLKARSPSCGLERVTVENEGPVGRGTFASFLVEWRPLLPVVQEDGVDDRFVTLVFEHARWRTGEISEEEFRKLRA